MSELNKTISVIIPVYNAEKWIHEALDSLVKQTYPNIEIVCVDDGSSDKSCDVIKRYQEKHSNITLIKQENAGVCAARNTGIQKAKGSYIAFLDADDFIEAEMCSEMIRQMDTEGADIIFCEFVRFWPNGKNQYTVEESFKSLINEPRDIKFFMLSLLGRVEGDTLYTDDIHGSSCRSIYKKEIIEKYGIRFHTDLRFAEDQIFVMEYLEHCNKVSYTDKPYVWYRGWTKAPGYHNYFNNHMALVGYQKEIIERNTLYNTKEKKRLKAYLDCTAYFMIINEVFMFRPDAEEIMRVYSKNKDFNRLLSLRSFTQKYRVRPEPKRIVLFILLKLRLWALVKKLYPGKRYG